MQNHGNKELHSVLLQSLAALREYDKVARWDEDMQDEVRALLMKMTKTIEKERLFYAMNRDIKLTDD
jgi:hypothetical protein